MKEPAYLMIIFMIGGFMISAGIFNWDWFYSTQKAQNLVRVVGRNGARIFYSTVGFLIILMDLLSILGVFKNN
jgi:hypothetical protein